MRASLLVAIMATLVTAGVAASACSDYDDGEAPALDAGADAPPADALVVPTDARQTADTSPAELSANGTACTAGTACRSGRCIDGVCCDSPCDGVCEKCDIAGSEGKCTPVPDGADPDEECPTTPLADAGAPDPDAGADAAPFVVPDGGFPPTDSNACAGHCNGKRACAFAGPEVTCGEAICGNPSQQGRASCDGQGHCLYGVEECSAYACPDGAKGCRATCTSPSDCLATHYCDGATNTCKPRLANGVSCTTGLQCSTGICAQNVCCNSVCEGASVTCASAGKEGTCSCPACSDGPCALFYMDEDGDGYGDADGTVANGRAKYGCANAAPPPGFVLDHLDCLDNASKISSSVHPGQTAYFDVGYTAKGGGISFDYDCSGRAEKETSDSGKCGVCAPPVILPIAPSPVCLLGFQSSCTSANQVAGHRCVACATDNSPFFDTAVGCGQSGNRFTCASCTAAGVAPAKTSASTGTQRCR